RTASASRLCGQQCFDDVCPFVVETFADVRVAHAPLLIEDHNGRPGLNVVSVPCLVIVVGHDRILDAERTDFAAHVFYSFLAVKFRRVNTDDGQATLAVCVVELFDGGQSVAAVVPAESPEPQQQETTA